MKQINKTMSFDLWFKEVHAEAVINFEEDELTQFNPDGWKHWYDGGLTPHEACNEYWKEQWGENKKTISKLM